MWIKSTKVFYDNDRTKKTNLKKIRIKYLKLFQLSNNIGSERSKIFQRIENLLSFRFILLTPIFRRGVNDVSKKAGGFSDKSQAEKS